MKIVVLVLLVLLIIVSGCSNQGTTQDPKQLLKESISKSSSSIYKIDYDFVTEFKPVDSTDTRSIKTVGKLVQYKKGNKLKLMTTTQNVTVSGLEQAPIDNTETVVYILPEGMYECTKINTAIECTKNQNLKTDQIQSLFNTSAALESIEKSIGSGQAVVKFNQLKTVASRKCFDLTTSQVDNTIGIRPSSLCLDMETGVPLISSAEVNIGSIINRVDLVATKMFLEVNDSEFVVPQ